MGRQINFIHDVLIIFVALSTVEQMFPFATVIGHANTLARIKTNLKKVECKGGDKLAVGDVILKVENAFGHTDGHMALFDPLSK